MSPERWNRVESILDSLLQAHPAEHEPMLDALCDDEEIRAEVTSLLNALGESNAFLERPAADIAIPLLAGVLGEESADDNLVVIGDRWRLIRQVGRGGMGTVYLADRADGHFKQQVALKLINRGMDSLEIIGRFIRERQILARLGHPNIARLLDGGLAEDGRPYFVMEFVEGEPITEYCDRLRLGIRERLRLFLVVCEAVHHAHQNLIVHRDLKPSNVLVTDEGEVKLLDFGIAKLTGEQGDHDGVGPEVTQIRVMTPECASPEMVRGEAVSTASDVYQLGLLLYELLTGRRPYTFKGRSRTEIERIILEKSPEAPSTRVVKSHGSELEVHDLSRLRGATPQRLRNMLAGDLDAILSKALRKEPTRRYSSAEGFALDVTRYLQGLPVEARTGRLAYRTEKFIRRNKWVLAAAAAFAVIAVTFGSIYTIRVTQERDNARLQAVKAERSAELFNRFFESWNPDAADRDQISAADLLRVSVLRAEREMSEEPEVQSAMLSLLGEIYTNIGRYESADSLLEVALKRQQAILPARHADLAATLMRIGKLNYQKGQYDEAEEDYRQALEMYRSLRGPSHRDALAAQLGLASVLVQGQDRFSDAEQLLRELITIGRDVFGDDALVMADATRALGLSLFYQAKYSEAEEILRPAVEMYTRLFGRSHPITLITMQTLAATVRDVGKVDESVALQREVLQAYERLYGLEHPNTTFACYALALNLDRQGSFDEAYVVARRAFETTLEQNGAAHPDTARYLRLLGFVALNRGLYDEAVTHLRGALRAYRTSFSYRHADEAGILNRLAYLLVQSGARDAREVYREAVEVHRELSSSSRIFVTYAPHLLAWAMDRMGDHDEAMALYRESRALYTPLLPPGHPYRMDVEQALTGSS